MAFVIAMLGVLATFVWCLLVVLANASMPAPSETGYNVVIPAVIGLTISGLIAASHWMPHVGW